MIELTGLTKRYGTQTVVDGVSGTIEAGGIISIIGANGAGKSTLLSMAARLLPMDEGSVFVDDLDVLSTPSDQLARKLSILRQENNLTVRLSVRDLVAFGRHPHSKGRHTAGDREHVERALRYLQLEELADRYVDELSGGQRQRAFIAMVIAQDTDYVLLDEPLNNLDMKHAVEMMRLLRQMAHDFGKTVVLVIHDINFASCYSDRIMAMKDGALLHHGTPDEIMRPAVLREIYGIDIRVEEVDGHRIGIYFV
ncbi:ATP-binding cassette domain-containing protein [Kocuria sp. CPCC 205292]|uniref:iron ABC transporter ATP-binding protein n=1 Tax=Kocuria cellulosilytica TaxID=3071451 RepID=UPI0034D76782